MKISNILVLSVLLAIPLCSHASMSSGTILSPNKTALVCHSVDCINPVPGIINFAPTGTTPVSIDDANGIDGVAWGNEIGWITFDPAGSEGLTIDASTGMITGKAWSQVSGWVNFSVTGQSVKINNNGEFAGYAWTGGPNGGWIKFDCAFTYSCVKTDWRPIPVRPVDNTTPTPVTGGSGGSTSQVGGVPAREQSNDTCLNITGIQNDVPSGYAKDQGGLCLLNVDYCKNISGIQLTIPSQYMLSGSGECVVLTKENEDEFILKKDNNDNSTSSVSMAGSDYCSNLFGVQSKIPDGFVNDARSCVPDDTDYCPNLLGNQYSIPEHMKISTAGECVKMTKQEIAQDEAFQEIKNKYTKKIKIFSFNNFVPDIFKIPVGLPVSFTLLGTKYQIDLISLFLLLNIIGFLGLWFRNHRKEK